MFPRPAWQSGRSILLRSSKCGRGRPRSQDVKSPSNPVVRLRSPPARDVPSGMKRLLRLRCSLVAVLFPVAADAAGDWSQLRAGMTREETTAVLGSELMASRGRGFDVAIYDGRAEVLYLNGQVVAWTAPAASDASSPPASAWQFDQTPRVRLRVPAAQGANGSPGANVRQRAILPSYRW